MTNTFTHGHYQWLVDIDDLPRLPWPTRLLAQFDARDHLDGGRLGGGLRGDVERFLARRGVALASDDRVLMLANARVLGHTFDPLSVFWCLRPDDSLAGRRLRGAQHLRRAPRLPARRRRRTAPRRSTRRSTSPPSTTSRGTYAVRLVLSPDAVSVTVRLERDGETVMTAVTRGTPAGRRPRALRRLVRRHGLMTQRVTTLIRAHGISLWLRRLPVVPRPRHPKEAVR